MDRSGTYFQNITKSYFANWLDVEPSELDEKGVFAKYSEERDKRQAGYGKRFDLYCFLQDETAIVSYGGRIEDKIQDIVTIFEEQEHIEDRKKILCRIFHVKPGHSYKYYLTEVPGDLDISKAVQLTHRDYNDFLRFFKSQHPKSDPESWLEDYFNSITDKGYIFGIYEEGLLVSATDAPDVPYISDLVVAPGINTLEKYRRRLGIALYYAEAGWNVCAVARNQEHLEELAGCFPNKILTFSCDISKADPVRSTFDAILEKFPDPDVGKPSWWSSSSRRSSVRLPLSST